MFATRLGGKFKEFPGLAKYVAMLKVSPAQGCVHHFAYLLAERAMRSSVVGRAHYCMYVRSMLLPQYSTTW